MGQKMSNAPIYFALAQVRFNTILALDQYLPSIQDTLRKEGYPDFERSLLGILNMSVGGERQNVPALQPQPRYSFYNETRTSGFILDQSMVMFQTTDYDVFETFIQQFLRGIAVVHDAATLNYSDRIGIRCLDAIRPRNHETLRQYLVPSVMGIYDELAPRELIHSYSEVRTKQGNTMLVSRAVVRHQEQEGNVAFPRAP